MAAGLLRARALSAPPVPAPAEACVVGTLLRRGSAGDADNAAARAARASVAQSPAAKRQKSVHAPADTAVIALAPETSDEANGAPTLLSLCVRTIAASVAHGTLPHGELAMLNNNIQQAVFDELAGHPGGVSPHVLAQFGADALEEIALPGSSRAAKLARDLPSSRAAASRDSWGYDATLGRQTRVLRLRGAGCALLEGFHFLARARCLRELDLSRTAVGDPDLRGLAANHALQRLVLRGCDGLQGDFLEHVRWAPLLELDLQESASLEDGALGGLAALQRLRKLNLGWCRGVGDVTLRACGELDDLVSLTLSGTRASDAGLGALAGAATLQTLLLARCKLLTGACVPGAIAQLPALRTLDVRWCPALNDEGFVHMGRCTQLETLNAGGSGLGDGGMETLAALPSLRVLRVDGCALGDAGLRHLRGVPSLEVLSAADTDVGNVGLAAVSRCPRLKALNVSHARHLTDHGVAQLAARARGLESLAADTRCVSDASMEAIGQLVNLHTLDLFGAHVTDLGALHLAKLTKLRQLMLCGGALTNASCAVIGRHLTALESLNLSNNDRISDAGAAWLLRLSALRVLNLTQSRVTAASVEQLACMPSMQTLVLFECPNITKGAVARLARSSDAPMPLFIKGP